MRLLVTGDRNWRNAAVIYNAIANWECDFLEHNESYHLISGDAQGADQMADTVVQLMNIMDDDIWQRRRTVNRFPADWSAHGRAAGPIRNQLMLDKNIDYVLGFHNDIVNSRGTKDMLRRCAAAGIPGRLFTEEGEVEGWQELVGG